MSENNGRLRGAVAILYAFVIYSDLAIGKAGARSADNVVGFLSRNKVFDDGYTRCPGPANPEALWQQCKRECWYSRPNNFGFEVATPV